MREARQTQRAGRAVAALCCAFAVIAAAPAVRAAEASGEDQAVEPLELTLDACIELGIQKNYEFLNEEESFILQQLATALQRHNYGRLWTSSVSADTDQAGSETEALSLQMAKRLLTGADLTLSVGSSGEQPGEEEDAYSSSAGLSIEQPLLRGAGRLVAREDLTQAERDLIYAGRELVLFRQQFLIDIVTQYYRLVQDHLQIRNQQEKVDGALELVRRTAAQRASGVGTRIDELRAAIALLQARNDLSDAEQRYRLQLDSLKLTLGLSMEREVTLSLPARDELPFSPLFDIRLELPKELNLAEELEQTREVASSDILDFLEGLRIEQNELHQSGRDVEAVLDENMALALARRLDLFTVQNQAEDARRALRIARNNLRGDLDLTARVGYSTEPATAFGDQRFGKPEWSLGLAYELPLDRVPEKTSYRQQLIAYGRSLRHTSRVRDQVLLDVRSTVRDLHRSEVTVLIQKVNVWAANTRLRRANALLSQGNAVSRDVQEALNELLDAKNAHDKAEIDHIIATLQLKKDTGLLDPDRWREEIQ
jgi:outer membrane protein TolC